MILEAVMNRKWTFFVVFAFVFVSALFFLQQILGIDYQIISLTQLAPSLAYIITIIIFKELFISIKLQINKTIIIKILFVIVIPLVLGSITFIIGRLYKIDMKINISSIPIVLFGIIIGAIGEEIGWRGFLQPTLDKKYPIIISSVIVGFIWAIWHIPYFFYGLLYMCVFIVFTISYSIIIVRLLKNTQYNIIVSSVFHISLNLFAQIFYRNSMEKYFFSIMVINSIIYLILATIIVLCNKEYFLNKNRKNGA